MAALSLSARSFEYPAISLELSDLYQRVVLSIFGAGVCVAVLLCFISAPYGRHSRTGWGPTLPSRFAWVLKETPTVIAFVYAFWGGPEAGHPVPRLLAGMYLLHYVYRSWVYPSSFKRSHPLAPWCLCLAMCSISTRTRSYVVSEPMVPRAIGCPMAGDFGGCPRPATSVSSSSGQASRLWRDRRLRGPSYFSLRRI